MYKRKYINPEIDLSESIIKYSSGDDPKASKIPNTSLLPKDIQRGSKKPFIPMAALGMSLNNFPSIAEWHKQAFGPNTEYETYSVKDALAKKKYRESLPTVSMATRPVSTATSEDGTTVIEETPAHTPVRTESVSAQTTSDMQPEAQESSSQETPKWTKPETGEEIPYHMVQGYNVGHMKAVTDLFDKYGIKYRIASGVRDQSVGNSGSRSWHLQGRGLDIAHPYDMSQDDFLRQFVGNKALLDELRGLNYGILNEYIPQMRQRTGGTGGHLHIGPDTIAWQNHAQFYNPNMPLYSTWT